MPKKPNYNFEKRKKEMEKKAKKEEKLRRKREGREARNAGESGDNPEGEAPGGDDVGTVVDGDVLLPE